MILKVRFQCETCPAHITFDGPASISEFQGWLRGQNWKLVVDGLISRHYCPACPLPENW